MSTSEEILQRALELDDEERALLALRLMDSLSPPDPHDANEWVRVIERRARRALAGGGGEDLEAALAKDRAGPEAVSRARLDPEA